VGQCDSGHAGESLSFAFSSSLQTGDGDESGSIPERIPVAESGEDATHDVSLGEAGVEACRAWLKHSLRPRLQKEVRHHSNRLSQDLQKNAATQTETVGGGPPWPPVRGNHPFRRAGGHRGPPLQLHLSGHNSRFGQKLAVFDKKQSLTNALERHYIPLDPPKIE